MTALPAGRGGFVFIHSTAHAHLYDDELDVVAQALDGTRLPPVSEI